MPSPALYKNCKLKRKISYILVQPNCFNRKANKNIFKGDNHFPVLKGKAFIEDLYIACFPQFRNKNNVKLSDFNRH